MQENLLNAQTSTLNTVHSQDTFRLTMNFKKKTKDEPVIVTEEGERLRTPSFVLNNGQLYVVFPEGTDLECFEQRCQLSELTIDFRGNNDSTYFDDSTTCVAEDDDIRTVTKSIQETGRTALAVVSAAAAADKSSTTIVSPSPSSSSSTTTTNEIRNQSMNLLNRYRITPSTTTKGTHLTTSKNFSKLFYGKDSMGKQNNNNNNNNNNNKNDMTPRMPTRYSSIVSLAKIHEDK